MFTPGGGNTFCNEKFWESIMDVIGNEEEAHVASLLDFWNKCVSPLPCLLSILTPHRSEMFGPPKSAVLGSVIDQNSTVSKVFKARRLAAARARVALQVVDQNLQPDLGSPSSF